MDSWTTYACVKMDAFYKIVCCAGVTALWSGLPPTLVMAVPATVIYFTCYDQLYTALRVRMGERAQEAPLLGVAIARGELTTGPSDTCLL
ncbi:hypothetical protein ILYODFUR_037119 [Ilyodon furcidens]|uniref:Uncharacterized protein n=1 Tax=Ilyodon furcidens TaxID=33524 RepID=A0ABV0UBI8_9TELE